MWDIPKTRVDIFDNVEHAAEFMSAWSVLYSVPYEMLIYLDGRIKPDVRLATTNLPNGGFTVYWSLRGQELLAKHQAEREKCKSDMLTYGGVL